MILEVFIFYFIILLLGFTILGAIADAAEAIEKRMKKNKKRKVEKVN